MLDSVRQYQRNLNVHAERMTSNYNPTGGCCLGQPRKGRMEPSESLLLGMLASYLLQQMEKKEKDGQNNIYSHNL